MPGSQRCPSRAAPPISGVSSPGAARSSSLSAPRPGVTAGLEAGQGGVRSSRRCRGAAGQLCFGKLARTCALSPPSGSRPSACQSGRAAASAREAGGFSCGRRRGSVTALKSRGPRVGVPAVWQSPRGATCCAAVPGEFVFSDCGRKLSEL